MIRLRHQLHILAVAATAALAAHAAGPNAAAPAAAGEAFPPFRFSFSTSLFKHLNENDAKAALKAYSQALLKEKGVEVSPEPMLLDGAAAIGEALRNRQVEIASLLTLEFLALEPALQPAHVIISMIQGQTCEEYLILVRRDGPAKAVADLKGRHLMLYDDARASLAPAWLEVLAQQAHEAGGATEFFGRIEPADKLSRIVLPVFFGQADACLATRRGFDTMMELNPQLGKSLVAVAVSPKLIPAVACFRPDYEPDKYRKVRDLLLDVRHYPAGKQLLNLFAADSLVEAPISCLDSTRELLQQSGRLPPAKAAAPAPGGVAPEAPPTPPAKVPAR